MLSYFVADFVDFLAYCPITVPAKFTVQDFSPKKIKVAVEKIKVVDELEEKVGDVITSPVNEILPEKIELTGGQSGE